MNHRNTLFATFVLCGFALVLAGCMPGTGVYTNTHPASFLHGVWHGWIAPISLIISIFNDPAVRIYEVQNSGWPYDLGFYMAIISGFGGISLFRRKK